MPMYGMVMALSGTPGGVFGFARTPEVGQLSPSLIGVVALTMLMGIGSFFLQLPAKKAD